MERRTCLCLSYSSKFLFSRLLLQPGHLKYRNGWLCITITCKTITFSQETVQILQHIDCWRALTGVIRRYGSLMRPGRSLPPPIYTCFDPSGVRKEGRGGGGCDRKVLSARMFFICSSSRVLVLVWPHPSDTLVAPRPLFASIPAVKQLDRLQPECAQLAEKE